MSLTKKTLHGIKWSYVSTISTSLMQIIYTAVMARLLEPKDFGLVAMAGIILRFGMYFSKMGLGNAIVQKKEITKSEIKAGFTSSVGLGVLFTIIFYFAAPLGSKVFDNSDVVPLIELMSLSFFLNGFSLTPLSLIRREMKFKKLAIAEITAYIIGYLILGIGAALYGMGVWSLVIATLSQTILLGLFSYLIERHPVGIELNPENYKGLFSFGYKVSIISIMEYISSTMDTFIIGRFLGDYLLGIYNRAFMLINLPYQYLTSSLSRVLFPAFSRIQDDNEKVKTNLLIILKIAAFILLPLSMLITILSKEIVLIVLGEKFREAIPLLGILSFAASANLIAHFVASVFEAKGLLKPKMVLQFVYIILLGTSLVSFYKNGLITVAFIILVLRVIYLLSYLGLSKLYLEIGVTDSLKVLMAGMLGVCTTIPLYMINHQNILTDNYLINTFLIVIVFLITQVFLFRSKLNKEIRKVIGIKINLPIGLRVILAIN